MIGRRSKELISSVRAPVLGHAVSEPLACRLSAYGLTHDVAIRSISSASAATTLNRLVGLRRSGVIDESNAAKRGQFDKHIRWQSQSMAAAVKPDVDGAATPSAGGPKIDFSGLQLDDLLLTPSAVRKLSALRAKAIADNKPNGDKLSLRIRVDGGGCSGFKYSFALESSDPSDEDRVFERVGSGARVIVDTVSLDLIKGSTVDWNEEMMRASFSIVNNPNSESSCGCGSSFSAKS